MVNNWPKAYKKTLMSIVQQKGNACYLSHWTSLLDARLSTKDFMTKHVGLRLVRRNNENLS